MAYQCTLNRIHWKKIYKAIVLGIFLAFLIKHLTRGVFREIGSIGLLFEATVYQVRMVWHQDLAHIWPYQKRQEEKFDIQLVLFVLRFQPMRGHRIHHIALSVSVKSPWKVFPRNI